MDLINKKSVAINKGKNNMLGSQFFNWFHHLHMGQLVMEKKKIFMYYKMTLSSM